MRFQQFKDYFWRKMESKTVLNISSLVGGVTAGSTAYYLFGFMVSGGWLIGVSVIAGAAGAGYTKWRLHKAQEMRQQIQHIPRMQVILSSHAMNIDGLHRNHLGHDLKACNHNVMILRQLRAIQILAAAAPKEVYEKVQYALNPPEDLESNLEGVTVEQLALPDDKSAQKWASTQRLFSDDGAGATRYGAIQDARVTIDTEMVDLRKNDLG